MAMNTIDCIAEMAAGFITDPEIMTREKYEQFRNALQRNYHFTSTYGLQLRRVLDINGGSAEKSGFYLQFVGARCSVNLFINNNLEITRRPRGGRVCNEYSLYNHPFFWEGFWWKYFH